MSTHTTPSNQPVTGDAVRGHYITFQLAGQEYAVDILRVQEIKGWDRVTQVPSLPSYVLGVINLRGAVVPIIDLRRRFAMPTAAISRTTVVIVLRVECAGRDRTMGIVVDAVSDVLQAQHEITPPPEMGAAVDISFIRGLSMSGDRMVIVLDIDRMLGTAELATDGGMA